MPVNTTSASRGMSRSMFLRLCSRAPRTWTNPFTRGDDAPCAPAIFDLSVIAGSNRVAVRMNGLPIGDRHVRGRRAQSSAWSLSDRKTRIPLNHLLAQQRPLARFPERCRVDDPVAKRTAIGTIAARDRAWNADELGPHLIAGEPHRRIAVTAHIHEFKVRRKFRIGNGVSALQIETLGVFEARADAVLEEHVVSPFGLDVFHPGGPCPPGVLHSGGPALLDGPIGQEQRAERMILAESVLKSLHRPGAGERGADETDPDRLERRGWQQRRRIAGPKAVTV